MKYEEILKETLFYDTVSSAEVQKREFILPGFPKGVVGSLIAGGGVGKSFYTLQLCIKRALGRGGYAQGKTIYLPAEDPKDEIFARAQSINKSLKLTSEDIAEVRKNLFIVSCLGYNVNLLNSQEDFEKGIIQACEHFSNPETEGVGQGKVSLIIYDTFRRFHGGNENDAGEMASVLAVLERVAEKTGAACLFLHHTSKAAGLSGGTGAQQASRGSSVLVDNIRFQCFMQTMTESESKTLSEGNGEPIEENRKLFVRWGVSKINYGLCPPDTWFKRDSRGVLHEVELSKVEKKSKSSTFPKYNVRGAL